MTVFSFSNARQNFAALLDQASKTGEVLIQRQDGRLWGFTQKEHHGSPLNVKNIKTGIPNNEIIN